MATIRIDEVNIPQSFDAEQFIREYFKPMRISKERKEIREEAARDFRDFLLFILALIATESSYDALNWEYIEEQFRIEMERAALKYTRDSRALQDYIAEKASSFVSATRDKDLSDPYWTSDERATGEAANDANEVMAIDDYNTAIEMGMKYKTWRGMMDSRERKSHVKMEGKKIPIKEYFDLDKGIMLYPSDFYHCPAESYNCRCSCLYTKT